MFRKAHRLLASLAFCGLLLARGAEGQGFGAIEIPKPGQTVSGVVSVGGFAIDFKKIDKVELFVDGILTNRSDTNLPRSDVFAVFPLFANSPNQNPGFVTSFVARFYVNGPHDLSVKVTLSDQSSFTLGPITVIVDNTIEQPPFGFIDVPGPDGVIGASGSVQVVGWALDDVAVDHIDFLVDNRIVASAIGQGLPGSTALYGSPGPGGPTPSPPLPAFAILNFVSGWALSTGTLPGKGSVVWVELLLDGAVISNTTRDCFVSNGKLTNCYGLNRPDVAQVFPSYLNGDNAGFSFAVVFFQDDPLGLLTVALPTPDPATFLGVTVTRPGKHTLSVRAGSDEGAALQVASISVDILCDSTIGNQPAFGYIDTPRSDEGINGIYGFSGWAYDRQGVLRIDVDVDGRVVARSDNGTAIYGFSRPDVPLNDPRVPPPGNVGWNAALDTTKFGDGQHEVIIYVIDNAAQRTEIGRRRFIVNN